LAVGLNAAFIFGLVTQTEKALSTDTFTGYELKNERRAHSFYLDYGLQYSMDRGDWMYTVGLIYSAAQKLKTTDYLEFTYNSIANELEQDEQSSIKIPEKIGLGIAIKKGRNFKAGFDYEQNHWSNITFSNHHLETNNSTRFSFGTEFCPGQKMNESWFKNIFYRLGANYKNSYLEIDNVSINSMGINLGLGIPINRINLVNFAIEYGEEGTLKKGLIKNSYWGFYLNFSLSELWAVRPRRG
jgi:long-subunit fatty acid transport protein